MTFQVRIGNRSSERLQLHLKITTPNNVKGKHGKARRQKKQIKKGRKDQQGIESVERIRKKQ